MFAEGCAAEWTLPGDDLERLRIKRKLGGA